MQGVVLDTLGGENGMSRCATTSEAVLGRGFQMQGVAVREKLSLFRSREGMSMGRIRAWFPSGVRYAEVVVIATIGGCMITPYDFQRVPSRAARVAFVGSHVFPGRSVLVQGLDQTSGARTTIVSARTSTAPTYTFHGVSLYSWNTSATIPDRFWRAGATESYARISAIDTVDSNPLMSMDSDGPSCALSATGVTDFVARCASRDSPDAYILTADYTCSAYGQTGSATSDCCAHDPALPQTIASRCEGQQIAFPGATGSAISETSSAFVRGWGSNPARLVTAYNDPHLTTNYGDGNSPAGSGGQADYFGWAFSTDAGQPCTRRNTGTNPTPRARGQLLFRGDPALVAANDPQSSAGLVGFATTGLRVNAAPPSMIVFSMSADGGQTSTATSLVNGSVGDGDVDQPDAAIDPTDHSVWVTWVGPGAVGDACLFVRGGRMATNADGFPEINWFDSGHAIPTIYALQRAVGPRNQVHTGADGARQIAVFYQHGEGTLKCPAAAVDRSCAFSVSTDGGASWQHETLGPFCSQRCFTNQPDIPGASSQVISGRRPAFVYDAVSNV